MNSMQGTTYWSIKPPAKNTEIQPPPPDPSPVKIFSDHLYAAHEGDANAMKLVSRAFESGIGTERDSAKAHFWNIKYMAHKGDIGSMYVLALLYKEGNGVEQNLEIAQYWERCAKQREASIPKPEVKKVDSDGVYKFAPMYVPNQMKGQVLRELTQFYLKNALSGDMDAMKNLAVAYENGRGIQKNELAALFWKTKILAHYGDTKAMARLIQMPWNGEFGLHQDQLEYWNNVIGALQGSWSAQFSLIQCYRKGIGTDKHDARANHWLGQWMSNIKGIANTCTDPYVLYGIACSYKGVQDDLQVSAMVELLFSKVAELYLNAAHNYDVNAMRCIALMYRRGEGVEKDKQKAIFWKTKCLAHQGNIPAMFELEHRYVTGKGVARDKTQAYYWKLKGYAHQEDIPAMYALADMLHYGKGVMCDPKQAAYWYESANQAASCVGTGIPDNGSMTSFSPSPNFSNQSPSQATDSVME